LLPFCYGRTLFGVATVNTLVLAYAGGALPMLLMFSLGHGNYGFLINFEFIAEEIVHKLVGSIDLVTAVPLTTAIALVCSQSGIARKMDTGSWAGRERRCAYSLNISYGANEFPGTTRVSSR
jgi:YibE/F-like protein